MAVMSSAHEHDARILAELAREMEASAPLELALAPATAFSLAGIVQLALRHPRLPPHSRATATAFLDIVRAHFAAAPTVLEVLRQGDEPAHDVPWSP
jgi:hypothetical protein